LLDKETYEPGPSLGALGRCRDAGIQVIFCSSKTRAEMLRYHEKYASHPGAPFVAENGGGVFFPLDHWDQPPGAEKMERFWKVTLGAPHEEVLRVLMGAAESVGMNVKTFSGMTSEQIALKTQLSLEEAALAAQRDFDEPFWIDGNEDRKRLAAFQEAIEKGGMRLTRGGRCFHVHGTSDKGRAAQYVRQCYQEAVGNIRTAAVGDAANDLPMFQAVDRAYLVKQADGSHDPDIPGQGNIRFMPGVGPFGFLQAVDDLLVHCSN
jgi:mannosyl-3-phosphoglycerate phosphatase